MLTNKQWETCKPKSNLCELANLKKPQILPRSFKIIDPNKKKQPNYATPLPPYIQKLLKEKHRQ